MSDDKLLIKEEEESRKDFNERMINKICDHLGEIDRSICGIAGILMITYVITAIAAFLIWWYK